MVEQYEIPDELLARCVGRTDLVQRVVSSYLQQMDQDIPALVHVVQEGRAEDARQVAHRVKGASANVAAECIRHNAEQLEQLASASRMDDAAANLNDLKNSWQSFRDAAASFVSG